MKEKVRAFASKAWKIIKTAVFIILAIPLVLLFLIFALNAVAFDFFAGIEGIIKGIIAIVMFVYKYIIQLFS